MKIGIDISQISYQGTGVARFTEGLVQTILKYDKENQWVFLFSSFREKLDPNLEKLINSSNHKLYQFKLPPTFLSLLFNRFHNFSKLLTFNFSLLTSLDWFITSDWTEPPLSTNKATIVHDLTVYRFPETVDNKILTTQKLRLQHLKKESKIIFADSLTTKKDLKKYLDIEPKKIVVNYPGVDIIQPTTEQIQKTQMKYNLNQPFLLTVGKIEPRKNLRRLIEAYFKLDQKKINLVVVGPRGWDTDLVNYLTESSKKNIRFLGLIEDVELYSLYSQALAFVYSSLWEGFGYPLIEAMSLGTPIICSNIAPFLEIAGEAAVYFDPKTGEDITEKITKVIDNDTLQKKLIERGKIRAKQFSWERYYNTLIKALISKY